MKLHSLKVIILLSFCLLGSFSAFAETKNPYLYVLGVVQDAGYPQAGCYEAHCLPGWEDSRLRRGAVSLGLIDTLANKKYMFEATPNFPAQLYGLEREAPSQRFDFSGIFLTHAHIGHYSGLMFLGHESMGASNIPVFSMPRMTQFLQSNGPWSQLITYKNIALVPLQDKVEQNLGNLKVTPFLVPHRDEYSETVGYQVTGPNKTAIFIPDINKWHQWKTNISELVKTVDYALLDAAFFADGELPGRDMSMIPHPFVTETMETLKHLPLAERKKVWFIHMNHTNPLLNPDSPESSKVKSAGFNIATEGDRFVL
ncbi:MBL fold metallo-hydrolase [Thalassotalea nanhaiensis]|uniref:MBL fold metallo-hydrolase n=1 Tax=Thalassotalea nanhaiensis TaxID=3065648 RepID=A0ABY9TK80_9GAMM|nr:MBL fold metallo-hydrolase [Colwelliaceae bacterium SQ345]